MARRFRLPFWAGWMALIAGAALFHLVIGRSLPVGTGSATGYPCWRNVYNCRDFRTRFDAQTAYQACGGRAHDVHRLDDDRDGFACEFLP
jgi:Excalibur calcium-binding domain